jgi:hypothetical protein
MVQRPLSWMKEGVFSLIHLLISMGDESPLSFPRRPSQTAAHLRETHIRNNYRKTNNYACPVISKDFPVR